MVRGGNVNVDYKCYVMELALESNIAEEKAKDDPNWRKTECF